MKKWKEKVKKRGKLGNTVGIQILDKSGIQMVNFRKARACDYQTIWNTDNINQTTIKAKQPFVHLITSLEIERFGRNH